MKISKFLVRGMLGVIFFRAPWPALRSSLLLYSQGFALLTFKNGVEIAASGVGLPVSMATPSPKVTSGPAVILEPAGASQRRAETLDSARSFKNQIFDGNHSAFWLKSATIANRQNDFPSHNSSQNLKKIKRFFWYAKIFNFLFCPRASPLCNLRRIVGSVSL